LSINTVAAIRLAVGSFLNRGDLTALIPDFLELAQARFNRELRVPQMLVRSDLATIDSRYEDVPLGYLETVRYSLLTTPQVQLEYLSPEEMDWQREGYAASDTPRYFSVVANTSGTQAFEFLPSPSEAVAATHLYYTALDLTTTNWLLTSHPDVVLYGALVEAERYVMNDERVAMWEGKLNQALASLEASGQRREVPGTPKARIRAF
jgi:hypothetical protein